MQEQEERSMSSDFLVDMRVRSAAAIWSKMIRVFFKMSRSLSNPGPGSLPGRVPGWGRAFSARLLALTLVVLAVFTQFESAVRADAGSPAPPDSSALVPSDTLALVPPGTLALVPPDTLAAVPSDTLALVPPDTLAVVPSDTLALVPLEALAAVPPDTLSAVPPDTLVAASADSVVPLDPFAIGFPLKLEAEAEFVRPWSQGPRIHLAESAAVVVPLPRFVLTSVPLRNTLLIDLDAGLVTVESRGGDVLAFLAYAAPLDEFQGQVGRRSVRAAWLAAVKRQLAALKDEQAGGLLDIDIPMPLPGPFVKAIGPGANLKVRGSERITFGGQTSYTVEALESESGPVSRWPQLDMEQQLTVNLEGTIGRKIHVYVDHRSGGETFGGGKANQIRVHYDGDEDEVIQKIELGEVNLSLPGTEFVSYSGHHEGLFGAKMSARVGRLDLVVIASKEEGESDGAGFTGSSESDSLQINDTSYKARTFFAVDGDVLKYSDTEFSIQEIHVYVDDRNGSNNIETGAAPGRAYLDDPVDALPPPGGPTQRGDFDELVELEDYLFDYQSGVIEFMRAVATNEVLAVSFVRFDGYSVGGVDGDSLRLKMLKREERVGGTDWAPIQRYELKHIYDLGSDDIPEDGFELTIKKRASSGEDPESENSVPFIQILGLDTHGLGTDPDPDGIVDLEWIDFEKGYLVFPHLTPFCPDYDTTAFYYPEGGGPDDVYVADELEEKNCSIYSKEIFDADDDMYYIETSYNNPQTTFYLGHINIIENSEVVRLNGVRLTRGVDYTIYYPAGQLTLLTEEAKNEDAKVTVEFDYKPFGIGGEKTLLGTRAVYNWGQNLKIGTTWMYQSKGTPDDQPRLGEEPSRTVVGDVNFSAEFRPELMTRIADAIPFIDTDAESSLKIAAEAAVSIPEPNTKGFVAIDDMEGTENVSRLGVTRRLWVPSSVPMEPPGISAADRVNIDWYNPKRKVREGDLHPDLPSQEANDTHTVLEIDHGTTGTASWAGLMRLLAKTGNDYSKYEFLELWVHDNGDRQGKVHIDLGTISEDYYPLDNPNGEFDSEDVDLNGFDYDEDTGLDLTDGIDGNSVSGDDGDDDYSFIYGSEDYTDINGTENNERLDTEDLNGNWDLDTSSKYWELTIDLSDTTYLVQDNSLVESGNHWRLYRIPLSDAISVNGMLDWIVVKSARLWLDGLPTDGDPLMIGGMDIVGSQWEPGWIRDAEGGIISEDELELFGESFGVTSKNTKEDLDYDPPYDPGTDENTNLPKREQSLTFLFNELGSGHTASARRVFYSDQDYTGYQSVELYVHGASDVEDGTQFFVRLGADSLNYYEYRFNVRPGWWQKTGGSTNRLEIPFTVFTDLKLDEFAGVDTVSVVGSTSGIDSETITRVGWPSLSRVKRITVGVRNGNDDSISSRISGEVWLDDIRLSDVRKEIGLAERLTIGADFADLLSVDFDLRHVDGEFHSLKQTHGSGQDNLTYNVNTTLNAGRFVSALGIAAPVNASIKKSVTRPKFSTGSDIVLSDEQSDTEQTTTIDRSVSLSLSRKRQSPDFWTHLLVDGFSFRASMADHQKLSPTRADTSSTLRGRASYKYAPQKAGIRIFGETKIFLKPTSIRFNADTHLIHSQSFDITSDGVKTERNETYDKKLNGDVNVDFQFLENLRTSHTVAVRRDLADDNRPWAGLNIGRETERRYSNSVSFNPKFGKWLSPQYTFSSSFTDAHGPEVRRTGDPVGVRNIRAQSSHQVRISFDLKKLVGSGTPTARTGRTPRRGRDEADEGGEEGEEGETPVEGDPEAEELKAEGPGFGALLDPVLTFIRRMDAIDGRYSVKRSSRFDRILWEEVPGWGYRLGLVEAESADDRTEERTIDVGTGVKLTSQIRLKGDYKRTVSGRWYKNAISDSQFLLARTESMNETSKGSLSWSGIERIGPLTDLFKSVRARSGVEYRRSYSGPFGEPSTRGNSFSMSPVFSVDTSFKNGVTGSFSWDKKRMRTFSLGGVGSITEDLTSSTNFTVNYRFSAPQGLKLPFFGQKLRFTSNLSTSLTVRTSAKNSRTARDEYALASTDPTSSTSDFSVIGDATYSFSRSVSGGLQMSFSQSKDLKQDQTRRTIGVHISAEFKF